jgi:hypothetical protein
MRHRDKKVVSVFVRFSCAASASKDQVNHSHRPFLALIEAGGAWNGKTLAGLSNT